MTFDPSKREMFQSDRQMRKEKYPHDMDDAEVHAETRDKRRNQKKKRGRNCD